jgi:hypothetical protein
MGKPLIDLTGQKFGSLKVLRKNGNSGGKAVWECICECGNVKNVRGVHLRSGRQVSCGCLKSGRASKQKRTHGHTTGGAVSPTYAVWQNMHYRCKPQNAEKYPHYAHVIVCERWSSFDAFLEDMGVRPDGLTIDRIDGSKGYSPDNCRWADVATQNRNRKSNVWVGLCGEVLCREDAKNKLGYGNKRMNKYVADNRITNAQLQRLTS